MAEQTCARGGQWRRKVALSITSTRAHPSSKPQREHTPHENLFPTSPPRSICVRASSSPPSTTKKKLPPPPVTTTQVVPSSIVVLGSSNACPRGYSTPTSAAKCEEAARSLSLRHSTYNGAENDGAWYMSGVHARNGNGWPSTVHTSQAHTSTYTNINTRIHMHIH